MSIAERRSAVLLLLVSLLLSGSAGAGEITPPAPPEDPASAMYTLEDIYQRLASGAPGAKRSGAFVEPLGGPGSTGYSLDDVMALCPLVDAQGALASEVLSGQAYWSLRADGTWGPQVGTMPLQALSASSTTLAAGAYAATTLEAVDPDLATANVRSGVVVFGIAGDPNVVDTSTGDAAPEDIVCGKQAWVAGALQVGVGGCDGLACCTGACLDTMGADVQNCGGCGIQCEAGEVCHSGTCELPTIFATLTTPQPSVWSFGGHGGIAGGHAMCQSLGADHVCTMTELLEADSTGELESLPDGQAFWVHRTSLSVPKLGGGGGLSAPGPGGRCNDWQLPADHIADSEIGQIRPPFPTPPQAQRIGSIDFYTDDDTSYTGNPNDNHQCWGVGVPGGPGTPGCGGGCLQGPPPDGEPNPILLAIPCCFAADPLGAP